MARFYGVGRTFKKGKGGIPARVEDADLIRDSFMQALTTTPGERVMRPSLGSRVLNYVFDSQRTALSAAIKYEILRVAKTFEPRIKILEITPREDDTTLLVDIVYSVLGIEETVSIPIGGTR